MASACASVHAVVETESPGGGGGEDEEQRGEASEEILRGAHGRGGGCGGLGSDEVRYYSW